MVNLETLPPDVKEYFAHEKRKIIAVSPCPDFTLLLTFDNGENRLFDMNEILKGSVFTPFRNFERFKEVFVDRSGCIGWDIDPSVDSDIVWNNRVDLCCDSCYIQSVPVENGK